MEGCANGFLYINSAKWAELAKSYQQMVTTVAEHVAGDRIAKYDSGNPPSIKRPVAAGARLRPVALDILDACYKASQELFAEVSAKNAAFEESYNSTTAFRNDQYAWPRDHVRRLDDPAAEST